MHYTAQITNGMLYDLIKDMKDDMCRKFNEVDRRFDEVDRRFDEVDKRFDLNERRVECLETDMKDIRNKLNELLYERDKVKITFSRTFATGTMFFSGLIAFIVAMFSRN